MSKYEVFEDNAGYLFLFVFDGDEVSYAHCYDNGGDGQLMEDLGVLEQDPDTSSWDGCEENPDMVYREIKDAYLDSLGVELVADSDGVYPENMGNSAKREFGIKEE